MPTGGAGSPAGGRLPAALRDGYATAMGQSLLLPAAVLVVGWAAVLLFARPRHQLLPAAPAVPGAGEAGSRSSTSSDPAPVG
jgi:hypothetical protein